MKVFISWSGERSKSVAIVLREWLPDVIQDVEPWMSAADIEAGARWSGSVQDELNKSLFGIICVTSDNQTAPWILFEAGALAKTIEDTYVCPYLIDIEPAQIESGPLTQFQAKRADEEGTRDLLRTINRAAKESALPEEKLERAFQRWWPDLKAKLSSLPTAGPVGAKRSPEDMIEEILAATREIRRFLQPDDLDFRERLLRYFYHDRPFSAEGEKLSKLMAHYAGAGKSAITPRLIESMLQRGVYKEEVADLLAASLLRWHKEQSEPPASSGSQDDPEAPEAPVSKK